MKFMFGPKNKIQCEVLVTTQLPDSYTNGTVDFDFPVSITKIKLHNITGSLPSHPITAYLRGTVYSRNLCKVKLSDEIINQFFYYSFINNLNNYSFSIHEKPINILTVYLLKK